MALLPTVLTDLSIITYNALLGMFSQKIQELDFILHAAFINVYDNLYLPKFLFLSFEIEDTYIHILSADSLMSARTPFEPGQGKDLRTHSMSPIVGCRIEPLALSPVSLTQHIDRKLESAVEPGFEPKLFYMECN